MTDPVHYYEGGDAYKDASRLSDPPKCGRRPAHDREIERASRDRWKAQQHLDRLRYTTDEIRARMYGRAESAD